MDAKPMPDLLEQAADWQIRLLEEPEARDELELWLAADQAHRAAWQQMQAMLGALAQLPAPPAVGGLAVAPRPSSPTRRKRRWPKAALVGAMLALVVYVMPQASLFWRADYRTGTAEVREIELPDGSRITLAPDSAIGVSADSPRQVQLLKGQAWFEVAPDPQQPFVATAGPMSVRVLGTAFELNLQGEQTQVALAHGQVQAENVDAEQLLHLSERLLPGDRLQVDWASAQVQRSKLDPGRIAGWRQQMLYVEDQSVAEIVHSLQRYSPGWIIIADPKLAQRRISGVFDLRDPDRALRGLARSLNVQLQQVTPWVKIL